jgi:hypothetical protein
MVDIGNSAYCDPKRPTEWTIGRGGTTSRVDACIRVACAARSCELSPVDASTR